MKKRPLVFVFMFISLLLIAASFLQPEDPGDLNEVLIWLALGPGAVYVAGRALSIFLEKLPGWATKVPESLRPYIVLALGIGLSFGAKALLDQGEVLAQIAPIYKDLVTIIVAWLGTQQQYLSMKASGTRALRSG